MATSQNGYSANDRSVIATFTIPGTERRLALRKGDTAYVLLHFLAWFDKKIESIDGGELDDWGYAERNVRGSSTTLSNHASGTGVDVNAPRHPLGKRGTFTKAQAAMIRTKLKEYDGVIRWGGDYQNRADEMHFEINKPPAQVKMVADRLRAAEAKQHGNHKPGSRTLKRQTPSMFGQDVTYLQDRLRRLSNPTLKVTGKYDQPTADIAAVFKKNRGITEPGFGPQSWKALGVK